MLGLKQISQAIVLSLVFLLILLGIAYVNYLIGEVPFRFAPEHVFVALVPFLILLIVSGQLKEIRGPGGIALSMRDEVRRPVSPDVKEMQIEIDPEIVMPKGPVYDLAERIAQNPPTTLSLQVGRPFFYTKEALQQYLEELERYPVFRNVVFVDELGKPRGLMRASDFKMVLQDQDLVSRLEQGNVLNDQRVSTGFVDEGSRWC